MKKINTVVLFLFFGLCSSMAVADKIKSLALFYAEVEQGTQAQNMRYIINDQFLRIDNGDDNADYILFDVNLKKIFSVNHDDQTILHIDKYKWTQPKFKFDVNIEQAVLKGAPKVQDKTVYAYHVKADNKTCTSVFLIKNIHPNEMNVLYEYQRVLSGQQVATLKNTPEEFQTPCFLVDQVYHAGEYYKLGLPLRIHFSRNYDKLLKDIKTGEFDQHLFELPESYKKYKAFVN